MQAFWKHKIHSGTEGESFQLGIKADNLTYWKTELDSAESELHDIWIVGETNLTALQSHHCLMDPLTRGWKNGIKTGVCDRS